MPTLVWSGIRKPTAPPVWTTSSGLSSPARVAHHPQSKVQAALLTARQVLNLLPVGLNNVSPPCWGVSQAA